ncbi:glycerophosphocholine phosphodiesterase GPCPD1-like isoform X2 [Ornithodoros turicata]|uniref:glycerophosphocholine phosphodiesterase GPCPD1-like isoform X2 n=1 Tax=Ornithodoros turicata TaxID=34597 RepID=UPI003139E5D9
MASRYLEQNQEHALSSSMVGNSSQVPAQVTNQDPVPEVKEAGPLEQSDKTSAHLPVVTPTQGKSSSSSKASKELANQVQSTAVPQRERKLRVKADTEIGETVFACGSTAELGEWLPSRALPLRLEDVGTKVWECTLRMLDTKAEFRYIIGILVGREKIIVRRWETAIHPRNVTATQLQEMQEVHVFGRYGGEQEKVQPGWLTWETATQFKFYNDPIIIWTKRYKSRTLLYRVSAFEITDSNPCVLKEGQHDFKPQNSFGHIYEPDEFVVVQCTAWKTEGVAYVVDFYVQTEQSIAEHIGSSYILPRNLKDSSGMLTLPITGLKQKLIGQVTVSYLIVKPLSECSTTCEHTFAKFWKNTNQTLHVGHRGAGNARRTDRVENVLENTIASFNYAASRGADMVELDVQLSKDMVPVIYHDYHLCIHTKQKYPADETKMEVAVKDLTVSQLQQLKLAPTEGHNYDFLADDTVDNQPFPTLQRVLEMVDPDVGVNIEIKCPMQFRDGTWEMDSHLDLNRYMDVVLKTVLDFAGQRYIIFSCFHPDICTMIRMKQNKYPLLFLTQGQTEKYPPYMDPRTSTVPIATYFALSASILGVNVHTEDLLRNLSLIQFVKGKHLILFCWGEDNNHSAIIMNLKERGVDGVIYDKVDMFVGPPRERENVYVMQCSLIDYADYFNVALSGSTSPKPDPVERQQWWRCILQ